MLRIAGATLNQTPVDWNNNLSNIKSAINEAREQKVELLCFPELAITGYGCEDLFLSDWLYSKSLELLERIVPFTENIAVVLGLPMKYEGQNYNCAAFVEHKKVKGIYAKQNMARDGVHYEPRWFIPWQQDVIKQISVGSSVCPIGDIIIKFKGIKIGCEICEDAWREDRPACRLATKNVDLIINPSASHFAFGKTLEREDLVISSSKNFDCTYLYVNLLGNEAGRMIYDGEILVAQHGQLLKRNRWLSFKDVDLCYCDVDIIGVTTPRLDSYKRDKNHEFAQASALALFDYLRKSKANGFVLSLSGGADSSTIAILVSEMVRRGVSELGLARFKKKLGINAIQECSNEKQIVGTLLTCAYQGTRNSTNDTFISARELALDVGATFHSWNIDDEVASYTEKISTTLKRKITWNDDDIALQNIQARSRSPIIWMLANIQNSLLLTTSNRSEGDVGYTTMDGDTSGSLAPIAAVDKHFIREWLKWAEIELGYESLHYVNNLQPSAELRPLESTQTDEDDLMPYHIMVEIEKLAIQGHKSPIEVFNELKKKQFESETSLKQHIKKFFQLWTRKQRKRERIAPAFHLDTYKIDPRN